VLFVLSASFEEPFVTTTRTRRTVAGGLAALMLASGSALLAAVPAHAATTHVPASSIAPDDTNYLGWHAEQGSFAEQWNGLRIGAGSNSYVLNGLVNTLQPGIPTDGTALGALIGTSSIVGTGAIVLEVPYSVTDVGTPTTILTWGTLRSSSPLASGVSPTLSTTFMSSRALGTIPAGTVRPLSEFLTELDAAGGDVRYSGFGFWASTQSPAAVVSSMNWDGDTYTFGRTYSTIPVTSTVNVLASEIRPDATTYTGWHEGYSTPGYSVADDGLHLGESVDSQVINGLATPISTTDPFGLFASTAVTVVSGEAFYQVPLTFGSASTFTTLRSDPGQTAGATSFSLSDGWASSRAIPATSTTPLIAATQRVPLGDLLEALIANGGVIEVLAFGVLADSGSSPAVVADVTFNGVRYNFVPESALAATGVNDATVPVALGGLALLLAGGVVLALRRRHSN
jgi:LPXTG-motif cell wall-anchored protein